MTKKSKLYTLRSKEKRDSRVKETQGFIIDKTFGSLLNNQKWYRIFEWIKQSNSEFKLKTLLSPNIKKANDILELEHSSILIDNSGDFIEFLELEQLILNKTSEFKDILKKLNVEFHQKLDKIIIQGYWKE